MRRTVKAWALIREDGSLVVSSVGRSRADACAWRTLNEERSVVVVITYDDGKPAAATRVGKGRRG